MKTFLIILLAMCVGSTALSVMFLPFARSGRDFPFCRGMCLASLCSAALWLAIFILVKHVLMK